MGEIQLTSTSYVVLGLLDAAGEATPYDMKRFVAISIGNFFPIPHSQLYAEPDRLVAAGYLDVKHEASGRRRKRYSLTDAGREALQAWRAEPTDELLELRDPGLLKLFLGSDPEKLAPIQANAWRRKLTEYESLRATDPGKGPRGPWLALDAGIRHAHESISFWEDLAAGKN